MSGPFGPATGEGGCPLGGGGGEAAPPGGGARAPPFGGAGPAQAVDRLASCRRRQPGARTGRDAVAAPGRERRLEGVLHRVFGQGEVADLADQRREDGAALLAEGGLDGGVCRGAAVPGPGGSVRRAHASAVASVSR